MKKLFRTLLLLIFISSFNFSFGQESIHDTSFKLNREITLSDSNSDQRNITINIKENTSSINLNISSILTSGDLTIEIYNSENIKVGDFTIESFLTPKKVLKPIDLMNPEKVSGELIKFIEKPMIGEWIIKIIPKKANGTIKINTYFNLDN